MMTDFKLKDAILAYIIEANQNVKDEKKHESLLPTYDSVKSQFENVNNERFKKQFNIVKDEFLEEKQTRPQDNQGMQIKVLSENKDAKAFLYDEGGYSGRHNKRILEKEVAKATKDSARASKSSSIAAWASVIAAVLLFAVTILDFFEEDELMPLLIHAQQLNRENKAEIVDLQNKIKLLEERIEVLYTNDTTLTTPIKTRK